VAPGDVLAAQVDGVIAGDPSPLTPLKIDRVPGSSRRCNCGAEAHAVRADLALGPSLGLVVEALDAHFCFECGWLCLSDTGASLRARLADWRVSRPTPDYVEPSLLYETDAQPRAVQLEVTTRCNLACAYCSHSLLASPRDVPWREFKITIDQIDFNEVDIVDFTGLGEATLNRDLPRMISEVARRGPHLSLRLVSNAVAASPERWRVLIDAGLTSIAFSIDTLDSERFARQRGSASLDKALRLVAAVAAFRDERKKPFALRIKAVLLDDVYHEAEALMRWSLRMGLDMPQFSTLDRRESAQSLYADTPWLTHALEGVGEAEHFELWIDRFWRENMGLVRDSSATAPRRYRHPHIAARPHPCRWVANATYVAAGGDILTCCESMIDVPRQVVGSIADKALSDAWRTELLWAYRLPLTIGRPPRGCVGCPHATPAQPRPA